MHVSVPDSIMGLIVTYRTHGRCDLAGTYPPLLPTEHPSIETTCLARILTNSLLVSEQPSWSYLALVFGTYAQTGQVLSGSDLTIHLL